VSVVVLRDAAVREPSADGIADLFPWKPSLALVRGLEWRAVHRRRAHIAFPVLDLGCGDGAIARLFFGDGDVVGLDVRADVLPDARRTLGRAVRGDARGLPFADAVYATVFGNCAVEHFPDVDLCLREIARVLRPGGVFLATVPSGHWKALHVWSRVLVPLGLGGLARCLVEAHDRRVEHRNLFHPGEWSRRLREAGLTPVAVDPYLGPANACLVTLLEDLLALPFPCPGFWTESGAYYFARGVLRRLGGAGTVRRLTRRVVARRWMRDDAPDGLSAGLLVVAERS